MRTAAAGVFLSLLLAFAPAPAFAATATFFGPLIPEECHCDNQYNPSNPAQPISTAPDFGCVMQTFQNGINLLISLVTIVFVLMIVIAGAQLVLSAGNPQKIQWAKTRILNIVIGLVVFLSAWLIVDFVMKTLYDGGGKFGPWNAILAGDSSEKSRCILATRPNSIAEGSLSILTGNPGTYVGGDGTGAISEGEVTHAQGAAALSAGGVALKSGVSLQGVKRDVISQVVELKSVCGCNITVTSGTDGSHAGGTYSHTEGYKLDLRLDAALTNYLRGLRNGGTRSNGDPKYYDHCGNEYTLESNHWDITINKGVCQL